MDSWEMWTIRPSWSIAMTCLAQSLSPGPSHFTSRSFSVGIEDDSGFPVGITRFPWITHRKWSSGSRERELWKELLSLIPAANGVRFWCVWLLKWVDLFSSGKQSCYIRPSKSPMRLTFFVLVESLLTDSWKPNRLYAYVHEWNSLNIPYPYRYFIILHDRMPITSFFHNITVVVDLSSLHPLRCRHDVGHQRDIAM